jgi:hypothetical protein
MTTATFDDALAPGLSTDPAAGTPITQLPLLIFVGVTGVGKSTTLSALEESGAGFTLLPDRRTLTDVAIIAPLQIEDGETPHLVRDRARRFDYTRRYRERYAGGMAQALTQLHVDLEQWPQPLCFDGLRGADEVQYAAQLLPLARFVVLDAPDLVRVRRLLGRGDAFDRIETSRPHQGPLTTLSDLAGIDEVFSVEDQQQLSDLAVQDGMGREELRSKVAIVIAERRNYDPAAAIHELTQRAPERTLIVDTTTHTPTEIAGQIVAFWGRRGNA